MKPEQYKLVINWKKIEELKIIGIFIFQANYAKHVKNGHTLFILWLILHKLSCLIKFHLYKFILKIRVVYKGKHTFMSLSSGGDVLKDIFMVCLKSY